MKEYYKERKAEREENEYRFALLCRYLLALDESDHDTLIAILHLAQHDATLDTMITEAQEELYRQSGLRDSPRMEALDTPAAIRAWLAQIGVDLPGDAELDVTPPSSR